MKFVRKCKECGCGMNEGYLWEGVGETWCSEKCLFTHGYTQEDYDEDYEEGNMCYTEWEEEDNHDGIFYDKDGNEI